MPKYRENISAVVDDAGKCRQVNHYYPYGSLMGESWTDIDNDYRWEGKRLNSFAALNHYDFETRNYDPVIPGFTSPDPLAEIDASNSPYTYCAANPIRNIDPSGMRYWKVNEEGKVTEYGDSNHNFDMIIFVDKDNNIKSDENGELYLMYEYGTIANVDINRYIPAKDENGNRVSVTMFHINGFDNAKRMFEFMSQPLKTTNVEWSHTQIGNPSSQTNIVGNAHSDSHTYQVSLLLYYGYTIGYDAHSHPKGGNPSPGDVEVKQMVLKKFPNAIFKLYRNNKYEDINP